MCAIQFGEIQKVSVSDIWPHEAHDFTPWLCENISKLGDALGMELEVIKREAEVGGFSSDILAKDIGRNSTVIIENQYGVTDHKHLGQCLTYASGYDAKTVIWIAEDLREEHRQTIDWLNQNTNSEIEFYGVVVEIVKIDDSRPAFNFHLVAFPNEWSKDRIASEGNASERGTAYKNFFQEVINTLREKYKFTSARKAQPQNWYSFSSGIRGCIYGVNFRSKGRAACEVYIDAGDQITNKEIFDQVYQKKDVIEKEMGIPLEWERLDNRRASRIAMFRPGSIDDTAEELVKIKDWMIQNLLNIRKVFPKYLNSVLENVG